MLILGGEIYVFGLEMKMKMDGGDRTDDIQIIQSISIQSISNARINRTLALEDTLAQYRSGEKKNIDIS